MHDIKKKTNAISDVLDISWMDGLGLNHRVGCRFNSIFIQNLNLKYSFNKLFIQYKVTNIQLKKLKKKIIQNGVIFKP